MVCEIGCSKSLTTKVGQFRVDQINTVSSPSRRTPPDRVFSLYLPPLSVPLSSVSLKVVIGGGTKKEEIISRRVFSPNSNPIPTVTSSCSIDSRESSRVRTRKPPSTFPLFQVFSFTHYFFKIPVPTKTVRPRPGSPVDSTDFNGYRLVGRSQSRPLCRV